MSGRILGAVLAGGQSRRFGSDKAFALWRGRNLIDHASAAVSLFADDVIICGREGGLVDRPTGRRGPLAGLNAALHWGATHGHSRILSIGCDTPLLPAGLLSTLSNHPGPCFAVECPVIGCWPIELADILDHFIAHDSKCSLKGWAAFIGAHGIDSAPIMNINTPADLSMSAEMPSVCVTRE